MEGKDSKPEFVLTDKEELAVMVQRIEKHQNKATDLVAKTKLGIAADLVRQSIYKITD